MFKRKTYDFDNIISYLNRDPKSDYIFNEERCKSRVVLQLFVDEDEGLNGPYSITYEIPHLEYSITYNVCGKVTHYTNANDGKAINARTVYSYIEEAFKLALPGCNHSVDGIDRLSNTIPNEHRIFFHSTNADKCVNRGAHKVGYEFFPALGEFFWEGADDWGIFD